MTLPDPAVVDATLRRLDTDALTALAADLWTARGFDVTREGDCLVVRRHEAERTVWVSGSERFRRRSPPARTVDDVLAPAANATTQRVAADHGARHIDARGLRDLLWYGVERPVWATLCERHLGGPPESLTPPMPTRVRVRSQAVASEAEAVLGRVRAAPTPAVAVVVVAVLLVAGISALGPGVADSDGAGLVGFDDPPGALGGGLAESSGANSTNADTGPTSTPASTSAPTPAAVLDDVATVPGVTRDGIENFSALTAAHNRAVANRSYTLWFDSYRQDLGQPETRVQRDVDIAVDGERYLLVAEVEANGTRTPAGRVYYDGRQWYVHDQGEGEANATWRQASSTAVAAIGPSPFDYRKFGLRQYLGTPDTDVVGVQQVGNQTVYRLVGRGTPPGPFADQLANYTTVVLVDSDGFVTELTVEYLVTADQPYQVRYEWTYGRLDETTVESPVEAE